MFMGMTVAFGDHRSLHAQARIHSNCSPFIKRAASQTAQVLEKAYLQE